MNVSSLIQIFASRTALPVDIEKDVLPELRKMGVSDEIYPFWDIELDPGTLQGYCHREEIPTQDGSYFMTTIGFAKDGPEMERLVTCKELLHILDPKTCRVSSADKVYGLISKIALRADLIEPFSDQDDQSDRVAVLEALAILFPMEARNALLPYFRNNELTLAQIAEYAELPPSYVKYALSDNWPRIHDVLIRGRQHREKSEGAS
ncbi:MAG: hypothetical protein U1E28_21970 [Beijerinckiaceae bacterium]